MDNRRPSVPRRRSSAGPGTAQTPREDVRPELSRRKQTLLSILDALQELHEDDLGASDAGHRNNAVAYDEPRDGPNVDERLQAEGAAAFERFQSRVKDLDRELQTFAHAVTRLGSSVGLLSSAFRLRQRLARILRLVRENAADLFPHAVSKDTLSGNPLAVRDFSLAKIRYKPHERPATPTAPDAIVDAEDLPQEIEGLAEDLMIFLKRLNEFPEFSDDLVNASITSFEGDLKYWANCLREFEGQFRFPGVSRYVHDLSSEIGEHFKNITNALVVFVKVGVPTIRFSQEHGSSNLLNLSTIATFFSAVTATTIQFTFEDNHSTVAKMVNGFWFSSLIFSIASAVNSLLGLTWRQAMYRSPGHRVPWWVSIWIKRSPLIFLVVSVAAFSIGLVLFTYSTSQPAAVQIVVTVFTACSSFGLAAVSSWFIFERWTFARHKGQLWLDDVLTDFSESVRRVLRFERVLRRPSRDAKRALSSFVRGVFKQLQTSASRFFSALPCRRTSINHDDDLERAKPAPLLPSPSASRVASIASVTQHVSPVLPAAGIKSNLADAPNARFRRAVQTVILMRAGAPENMQPVQLSQKRQVTSPVPLEPRSSSTTRIDTPRPLTTTRFTHLNSVRLALQRIEPAQSLPIHQALVRHLAFSPSGKYLATCSWDSTSTIVNVSNLSVHRVLAHPNGFVGQVMWSPNGKLLLTKLTSGINVWTEDGVCKQRIDRRTAVHSVAWFSNGTQFLSIEANEIVHLDLKGTVLDRYPFERLRLHEVAVAPDAIGERLFAVATLERSKDGFKPIRARPEKRIIVYNRLEKEIEIQVPVLNDVRDITISKDGSFALVSYENKAAPQLWRIGIVKGDARLTLLQTYMPKEETDFAGPSYFGGKDDQLVLCASKAGAIHFWDRESGTYLHHIEPDEDDENLTCIAWNHASENHMFATGTHEGTVFLWQAEPGPNAHHWPWIDFEDNTAPARGGPRSSSPGSLLPGPTVESPAAFGEQEGPSPRHDRGQERKRTVLFTADTFA